MATEPFDQSLRYHEPETENVTAKQKEFPPTRRAPRAVGQSVGLARAAVRSRRRS